MIISVALDKKQNLTLSINQTEGRWYGEVCAPLFGCSDSLVFDKDPADVIRVVTFKVLLLAGHYCVHQMNLMINSSPRSSLDQERERCALLTKYLTRTADACRKLIDRFTRNHGVCPPRNVYEWIDQAINMGHMLCAPIKTESKYDMLLQWTERMQAENAKLDNAHIEKSIQSTLLSPKLGIETGNVLLSLTQVGTYEDCSLTAIIAQEGQEYIGNAWHRDSYYYPAPIRGDLDFVIEQVIYRACWVSAISSVLSLEAAISDRAQNRYGVLAVICYLGIASIICRQILMFCEQKEVSVNLAVISVIDQIERWRRAIDAIKLPDEKETCLQICKEIRGLIDQLERHMIWGEKDRSYQF